MNYIWLLALSIVTYIVLMYIGVRFFMQELVPPKPVRFAARLEVAFGTIVFGSGVLLDQNDRRMIVFCMLLGLFWIGVGVSLCRKSRVGRIICLVLSILRIPTIIGAIFSLLSIYKLYFTQESKDFFNKINVAKNNP